MEKEKRVFTEKEKVILNRLFNAFGLFGVTSFFFTFAALVNSKYW